MAEEKSTRLLLAALALLVVATLGVSAYAALKPVPAAGVTSQDIRSLVDSLSDVKAGIIRIEGGLKAQAPGAAALAGVPEPPAGKIALKFKTSGFKHLEGLGPDDVTVHEANGAAHWTTKSYKKGERVDIAGAEIKDGTVFLAPGEEKLATFVVKSRAPRDQKFQAVPHTYVPQEEGAIGAPLMCWCTGQFYDLPAEGSFARVIKVIADKKAQPGLKVIADHALAGKMA